MERIHHPAALEVQSSRLPYRDCGFVVVPVRLRLIEAVSDEGYEDQETDPTQECAGEAARGHRRSNVVCHLCR